MSKACPIQNVAESDRHHLKASPSQETKNDISAQSTIDTQVMESNKLRSDDNDKSLDQPKIQDLQTKKAANKWIFQKCVGHVMKDAFQDLKSLLSDESNPKAQYFMRVTCLGLDKEEQLSSPESDVSAPTTLVHLACERISINCLVTLLELKASPNVMLQHGHKEVPLHFAVSKDSEECARILLEHKATVDIKNGEGKTALHIAAGLNSVRIAALLVRFGADKDQRDNRGRTPLQYAQEKGNREVGLELRLGARRARNEQDYFGQGQYSSDSLRSSKRSRVDPDSWEASADPESWKDPRNNPHSMQVVENPGYTCKLDLPFSRVLGEDMPRVQYKRRKGETKTVIHWGQRKLLMSEIEFLTLFSAPGRMVVYAGAAPGTHIAFLSGMFPELRFFLVDPAPFTVKPNDKIEIVQDLFSNEMAQQLGEKYPEGLLFISDIRSADWERDNDKVIEEKVKRDMAMQQEWHMLMRPLRSMFKFRLPWAEGSTDYLDGDVFLPVWGPITTTETRLITKESTTSLRSYDHKKYEEQLFYFNTVVRPALYPHGVRGEGIDHCYDCRAEVEILSTYLTRFKAVPADAVPREVQAMSRQISRQIAGNRTLADPNPDPGDRKKRIQRNQWINNRPAYENYAGYGRQDADFDDRSD